MPLDHIGINVPDVAAAREYYDALMPMVGFEPFASGADWCAYGPVGDPGTQLFLYPAPAGGSYSRDRAGLQHLSFLVETRAAVHTAYEWAVARGDEILHTPQTFPQYHPDHYAAFWVEPHGFKIEVVSFGPSE